MTTGMVWRAVCLLLSVLQVAGQSSSASPGSSRTTSFRPEFTVPSSADLGATLLPNIYNPDAPVAQDLCPGYYAAVVSTTDTGLIAKLRLAGDACNVYGTDIRRLDLLVEYQTDHRLHVNIQPSHITAKNESWYVLSTDYVPAPSQEQGNLTSSDLTFSWANTRGSGFGFNVTRNSTGELLFSTTGTKLVYENQFIEFVTSQPENYNVYGLGEVIHELRLSNNFTRTIYAADVGDPIDRNLYGSHPFYLNTRYYSSDGDLLTESLNSSSEPGNYTSSTHGVYLRNAHGQEVLMNPTNITWRTLGGSIDLYFFSGPTQPDVTRQYLNVIGKPTMQQYWTFGFHQCRWGYANWSEVEAVVDAYENFGVPLETIWTDIDYMNQYRDFDNDQVRYSYEDGQAFLEKLHASGRHYVPIIDAAIYVPNPRNESDAYPVFNDGNDTGSYLLNDDGSLYIGAVWPGYTVFPDWTTDAAHEWWTDTMIAYHKKIPIDGAWIGQYLFPMLHVIH
jgi:alpha-glucosidase